MSDESQNQSIDQPHSDNLEQYLIFGRRQIRQLLQELIDGHALISAHISTSKEAFLTALITLSEDDEWIFLDVSPNESVNQKALQAERLICVTQLNKIRIQFSLNSITAMQLDGRTALAARVPAQMARMQRREFYRLQIPLAHALTCHLPPLAEDEEPFDVRVIDISPAGIALNLPLSEAPFDIGTVLKNCRLELPEGEPVIMQLEIRNIIPLLSRAGTRTQRLGCRFAELPQAADVQIQRYILKTERERSAREHGGL